MCCIDKKFRPVVGIVFLLVGLAYVLKDMGYLATLKIGVIPLVVLLAGLFMLIGSWEKE